MHHRRRTDTNGDEVHERSTDHDLSARIGVFVDHFKLAWLFFLAIAGAAGWVTKNYLRPLSEIPGVQAQLRALVAAQAHGDSARVEIGELLKVVVRIECFNLIATDRVKYGMDCSAIPTPHMP